MKSSVTNPSFFRVITLLSLEISEVDSLARKAVGSLTSFRLLLGRCLLAMRERKGFKKFGCSSEIHYSVCRLGLSEGVAGDCRRVARDLLGLPDLTLAAEQGTIEWGKLREVSRKASPETEGLWLKLCGDLNYKQIEKLVAKTPKGGVPGDAFEDDERSTTEFRCRMSEEVLALLDRARRMYSLEQDKAVTTVEVLEWALASYISSQPVDEESLEKVRVEMDKDLQAVAAAQANAEYIEALKDSLSPIQNKSVCFNPGNRHATKAQKREVLRREGWCCATPGCPHKIWLHLHHLIPYSQGGPTLAHNVLGICVGCHCNVHDGSLKIFLNDQCKLVFTDADGNCLTEQADLMLAGWLDFHEGWHGEREDSYRMRWGRGDWSVFEKSS